MIEIILGSLAVGVLVAGSLAYWAWLFDWEDREYRKHHR